MEPPDGTRASTTPRTRADTTPRVLLVAVVALTVLFLTVSWVSRPFVGGDTPFVLDGTNAFLQCMEAHVFVGCGHTGELNDWGLTSSLGDWPLLQHLPDLALLAVGVDGHPNRTRALSLLSVAGVLGSVALGWLVLTRTGARAWFWGYVFVLLSGPVVAYGRNTAGEMFAMGLLVSLVAATVLRAPPLVVGLAAFGASVTKETSYPFVVALGLLGLVLARRRTGDAIGRHVVWGAGGVALALVATSLFNVVRFGSVLNTNYLDEPELHTPGIARTVEYFAAVLVSPSGGILVFWPAATVLLVAACVLPFVRGGLNRRPALVIGGAVVLLAVGFARWWTPFGWSYYGPRLMLPWLLPLVLLALVAYGRDLGPPVRRVLSSALGVVAAFVVVLALTLPHIGHMLRPDLTGAFFATKDPPCVAPHLGGVESWHDCQHDLMWFTRPMPLYAAEGVESFEGLFNAVVVAAGLLGCLVLLRRDLQQERSLGPSSGTSPDTQRRVATAPSTRRRLRRLANATRWKEPLDSRWYVGLVCVALGILVLAFHAAQRPVEAVAVTGSDVSGYQRYGSLVLDGAVPYRDFDLEYPPGSLALFVPPGTSLVARGSVDGASWSPLNIEARRYYRAYTALVLFLLGLILVLTATTLRAMNRTLGTAILSLAVVALSPMLLGQVLIERFDVLPAAFTAAALAASVRGRFRAGGAILGVGAAVKIYPALLVPVLAIAAFRQRGRGEALRVAGIAVAAAVAVVLPFAAASPGDTWNSLQVQFRGGLQIEALASSVLVLTSHAADAMDVRPFELVAQGAGSGLIRFELDGPGVAFVKTAMNVVLGSVLCWLWVSLGRSRRDLREELLRFAAATVAAVLALGTILSPQYVVWLLPVVPLVAGRRGVAAVGAFAVAAYLTGVWFPDRYFDYQGDLEVGPAWLLLARNLALFTVLLALLVPDRRLGRSAGLTR